MQTKTKLRKTLTYLLAGGATLAVGLLSFAGMFVLSSSLILCGGAFILATAYEGQVNSEGITKALRRLFTKDFLKKGIIKQYLENLIEQENAHDNQIKYIETLNKQLKSLLELQNKQSHQDQKSTLNSQAKQKIANEIIEIGLKINEAKKRLKTLEGFVTYKKNQFYIDYKKQKNYVDDLNAYHEKLHKAHDATSVLNKEKRKELATQLKKLHIESDAAKTTLRLMEQLVFNQIQQPTTNQHSETEASLEELLTKDRQPLLLEMNRKKWIIRLGAFLALGGGVSSFFVTMSSMQVALASLTILSAIPGGVLITLSVLAAAGYTLLLYQSISDMVQEYSGKVRSYFEKRGNESSAKHLLRCTGTVLAIAIAVFATIATAGTWWYAVKNGTAILNIAEKVASTIQAVSISMMALPSLIFTSSNSVASVDNISQSDYKLLAKEAATSFKEIRYLNPFHFAEKLVSGLAKSLLFLGHIISIGLMSDRLESIPPIASASAGASSEALTDLNYMPGNKKQHTHESLGLSLLFLPVTLTVMLLKGLATVWDWGMSKGASMFTGESSSFTLSKERMFPTQHTIRPDEIRTPALSPAWVAQEQREMNSPRNNKHLNHSHSHDDEHDHSSCAGHSHTHNHHDNDKKHDVVAHTSSTTTLAGHPSTLFAIKPNHNNAEVRTFERYNNSTSLTI